MRCAAVILLDLNLSISYWNGTMVLDSEAVLISGSSLLKTRSFGVVAVL